MKNLHVYKIRSMIRDNKTNKDIIDALKLEYAKEHIMSFIKDIRGVKTKVKK